MIIYSEFKSLFALIFIGKIGKGQVACCLSRVVLLESVLLLFSNTAPADMHGICLHVSESRTALPKSRGTQPTL